MNHMRYSEHSPVETERTKMISALSEFLRQSQGKADPRHMISECANSLHEAGASDEQIACFLGSCRAIVASFTSDLSSNEF